MTAKTIVLLNRFNPKKFGSYEEFLLLFSKKLVGKGYRVIITFAEMPPDWLIEKFKNEDIVIKVFDFRRKIKIVFDIFFFLRKVRPDILLISFISIKHVLIPFIRILKIPLTAYVFHSFDSEKWKPLKGKNIIKVLKERSVPFRIWLTVKSVDRFICVSKFIREKVNEKYHIPSRKLVVIYNGVNPGRFESVNPGVPLMRHIRDSEDVRVITAISNLIFQKGIQYLLTAFREVIDKHPKAKLIIVGEGPYGENLKEQSRRLDLEKKVLFLGLRNDVGSILHLSDIVVVPSICDEAFAYVVVEGMFAGKPIIASKIGGISEAIQDNRTGLFCVPGDPRSISEKICYLLRSPEIMERIAASAREYANENYDIKKQINGYLNVLDIR